MFKVLVLSFLLLGCSTAIIPKTAKQAQTVAYSQITSVTLEVYQACAAKVITKDECIYLRDKIEDARRLIEKGQPFINIIERIRSEL